jgi:hypothetical protein
VVDGHNTQVLNIGLEQPDARVGAVVETLLRTPDWVLRRVEKITFINCDTITRQSTLDVSLAVYQKHCTGGWFDPSSFLVPLTVMKKDLLTDFNLRDGSDKAISVISREVDTFFAWSFLCSQAAQLLGVYLSALLSTTSLIPRFLVGLSQKRGPMLRVCFSGANS